MNKLLRVKRYRVLICTLLLFAVVFIIDISGIFRHMQEKSFQTEFSYPLETPNFLDIVQDFRLGRALDFPPTNNLYSRIPINSDSIDKCNSGEGSLSLLILVKSAPSNHKNRNAIRETWKISATENNGKLLFFIGHPTSSDAAKNAKTRNELDLEASISKDIVRLDFHDSYFNNTIKTMLEMRWAVEECAEFAYALLVDDDYYVSIKNLLQYVQNPVNYPASKDLEQASNNSEIEKLYAGYRMFPPPHRHKIFTKWFVPLEEYPYDYFPPYITAGAILLSRSALFEIHYASYFVTHFRFDDIYVAICAKKMNITPINSEYFRFWTTRDESPEKYLIASHGFSNPERLFRFWNSQKSNGFC